MGNQITAKAPAQILPLESYFTDLTEYNKPTSLGSTRFFKVARATHSDGVEVVVKVFVKQDSVPLAPHKEILKELFYKLHRVANILPFQKFWETDKAAYLVRQHIHYNLYDRISTRPFLSVMEKKWIVFQLLKVLEECQHQQICHGDIKTENVLLTGWDWILLADFASFKPTLLPDDNPAEFSFFFDTSRRRTCYIAPERFCPPELFQELTSAPSSSSSFAPVEGRSRILTHQMDIFSLGCVIAELFMDGRPLFDLSQLLDYYSGERETTETTLKRINDKFIRRMVRHMIQLNPNERFTAHEYLQIYKEDVFPSYFYTFLHDYFKLFCSTSLLTPDHCIKKLHGDVEAILANLIHHHRKQDREVGYGDALVVVLSAITSHLRLAQFVSSKLQALEMMKRISHHITDEFILERILPFLVLLVKDKWPSVRAEALRTLNHCLGLVRHLPQSDFNLFPEYILPRLKHISSDRDMSVRVAFAECVAELASTAHRFLELAQLQTNQEEDSSVMQYQIQGSYDSELIQLQETFAGMIVHLLSDTNSAVKKAFLKNSAGKLCVFYGPQKAKDVILSHMITFLNDKSDWELHGSFFECIVDVAMLLRHHSLPILEPLLQQGLSDGEETVVCKTIKAMTTLCSEKLFDHQALVNNVSLLAPFLVHPSIWLRYGAVGFLLAAADQMDNIDVECYIVPRVTPYLKHQIIQLKDRCVFLSALKEPVPRGVMDYILKQPNISEMFESLTDRQMTRNLTRRDEAPVYNRIEGHLIPMFRKLQSLGLNEEHENSLMALKDLVLKQHYSKQQFSETESRYSNTKGVIDIKSLPSTVNPKFKDLVYNFPPVVQQQPAVTKKRAVTKAIQPTTEKTQVNEDWERIFGGGSSKPQTQKPLSSQQSATVSRPSHGGSRGSDQSGDSPKQRRRGDHQETLAPSNNMSRSSDDTLSSSPSGRSGMLGNLLRRSPVSPRKGHKRSSSDGAIRKIDPNVVNTDPRISTFQEDSIDSIERSMVKVEYASCKENLRKLLNYKQKQFVEDMKAMDNDIAKNAIFQSTPGWTPKGQLVAHIHEHKDSVNRICVLTDSTMFATFSDDGTTKLWDVQKLEGRNVVNRAKFNYNAQGGQIKAGVFCQNNRSIAAASSNGSIQVFNFDSSKKIGGNSKRHLLMENKLDLSEYGTVIEMVSFTAGGQDVICYATSRGKLCGLDLRSNRTVWNLTNNSRFGLTLSMAVDPFENWVALGTSLGYHVIWDMRFQLPIRHWQHEGHAGKAHVHHVYRLCAHPTQPSSLISAVSGNNEVSIWDMETASRRQMLWASPAQPFGEMTDNPLQQVSVRGMSTCIIDHSPVVLAGGTDRTIRLWNLADPTQCSSVVRPKQHSKRILFDYKSKIIEGVDVFKEVFSAAVPGATASSSSTQVDSTTPESAHIHSHVDFITDLAIVPYKNQQFLISASHDGVLKLWK